MACVSFQMLPGIRAWVVLDVALEPAAGFVEQLRSHRDVDLRRGHAAVAEIGRKRWQEPLNIDLLAIPRGQAVGGKGVAQRVQASRAASGFAPVDPGRPKRRTEGIANDALAQRRSVTAREEGGLRALDPGARTSDTGVRRGSRRS